MLDRGAIKAAVVVSGFGGLLYANGNAKLAFDDATNYFAKVKEAIG